MLFTQVPGIVSYPSAITLDAAYVSRPFQMPLQDGATEHWLFDSGGSADLVGRIAGGALTPLAAPTYLGNAVQTAGGLLKGIMTPYTDASTQTFAAVLRRDDTSVSRMHIASSTQTFGDGGFSIHIQNRPGDAEFNTRGLAGVARSFSRYTTSAVKTGGNVGNGTCSTVATNNAAVAGVYQVRLTSPTAFSVTGPAGAVVGNGVVGTVAEFGGLRFGLVAGATAFAAGDGFDLTCALPAGKCQIGEWFFVAISESPAQRVSYVGGLGGLATAGTKNLSTRKVGLGNCYYNTAGWEASVACAELIYSNGALTAAQLDAWYAASKVRMAALGIALKDA